MIIDVGCGGEGWNYRLYPYADIYCDLSIPKPTPTFFIQCDARFLPFRDGCFELVVSRHMLEHIPDFHKALLELIGISRKVVYIVLPHKYNRPQHPDHKHFFTIKDWDRICRLLRRYGLIKSYEVKKDWKISYKGIFPNQIYIWVRK